MDPNQSYTPLQEEYRDGKVILIDKPLNWTSFDVVNKLRWRLKNGLGLRKIKVGHAGTLDPLATGLLILCTGKFTKKLDEFQADEKEYTGTIVLGATTPSYDLESEIDATFPIDHLTNEAIHDATAQFTGKIEQLPPIFSAIKVDGKRAYESARKGKELKLAPRSIEIMAFEITRIALPEVDFRVVCSKGTYIRSLAHDFGKALDTGSHLAVLRRTKSGTFSADDAKTVEEWLEDFDAILG